MSIDTEKHIIVLAMLVVILGAGCSSVTTVNPLSLETKPLDKDKFEGTWLLGKESVSVRFASNGVARIAGVRWENDQFRLEQREMIITEGEEYNFLSIRFEEDGKWTNQFFFLQYHFTEEGDLLLWLPNSKVFEEAIKTNRLQGVKHNSGVIITNTPGELLKFINNSDNLQLFEYREPIVVKKVAGQENADQPTPNKKK
jgi:hypothetical protein